MKADGYKLPLYARFDTDAQHGADAWRCYSPSSLTPSLKHYSTGIAYCTHEATLAALAWDCEHNVTNLFPAGARGVHEYRIPLLLNIESASSAACGTLLAFAEARIFSSSDRGPKHIAMRRSTDCGVTWDPIQFIVSDNSTDPSYDGLNLGSAVYDAATHTVTVVFVECAHSCKVAPLYTIASTDSGSTWAASGNLTDAMLAGGVRLFAPGPGTGLVLPQASGATRLLIPGWFRPTNSADQGGSTVLLSDDHGATWHVGGKLLCTADVCPNECQAAALVNGSVLMNMRNENRRLCDCRLLSISNDGGNSWGPVQPARTLADPVCQGSTISTSNHATLYFSNADNALLRINGTVHSSTDGGTSWREVLTLDPAGFAYSGLALLDSSHLAAVWESVSLAISIHFGVRTLPAM